jgi:hypothetical protein
MIAHESQLSFDSEERDLLHSALNEVVNGFEVTDFERTIGAAIGEAENLLVKLRRGNAADHGVTLNVAEARAARNALSETIRELGVEEFHIRTGVDFDRGKSILEDIDRGL